jgi:formiminoglutamate deiminase
MSVYWCEHAWLPDGPAEGVQIRVDAGVITEVSTVEHPAASAYRLRGMSFPGFANAHSHAFHRALRGRTGGGRGSFWTWREQMYGLAGRLDPDSYHRLARAVYAEMVVAGYTSVGEFHYLHHAEGGAAYREPNAMAAALAEAAADAGIRLTLLDTCYLAGGIGRAVSGEQLRFSDGDADAWAQRVAGLVDGPRLRIGAAIHSVRAVPEPALATVAAATGGRPLHVHLSEQPAENEECRAAYGRSPAVVLRDAGVLGAATTAVHATHLSECDVAVLGSSATAACFCPSTEADLGDGIGPARELLDAGSPLCLGSDQHALVDPVAEVRALEYGERLRTGSRGRIAVDELVTAATVAGQAGLGWPECGRIAVGATADITTLRLDTPRTAGCLPGQAILAATASDVDSVLIGGRQVAENGEHRDLGDIGALLAREIAALYSR